MPPSSKLESKTNLDHYNTATEDLSGAPRMRRCANRYVVPIDELLETLPLTVQPLAVQAVAVVALHLGGGDARRALPPPLPLASPDLGGPCRLRLGAPHRLACSPSAFTSTPASSSLFFQQQRRRRLGPLPLSLPTIAQICIPGTINTFRRRARPVLGVFVAGGEEKRATPFLI